MVNLENTPVSGQCRWCGAARQLGALNCPSCGVAVHQPAPAAPSSSGWEEMPAIANMAKLRVGTATCQIEGTFVPVADFGLAAGDKVYFAHHVLLWRDDKVSVVTMPLKGAWKRLFAGMPLVMTEAHGPGHIAFSRDDPGEMIALPLQPGQSVDVREHMFLVATHEVTYDWFTTGIWLATGSGKERETHYPIGMFMDRFSAGKEPGLLLLHATGNAFVRNLDAKQTMLVKPAALIYKDPSVSMSMHLETAAGQMPGIFAGRKIFPWLRLHGPGRVAVQSAYEPMETDNKTITGSSQTSSNYW